jgi:hypothetical protein
LLVFVVALFDSSASTLDRKSSEEHEVPIRGANYFSLGWNFSRRRRLLTADAVADYLQLLALFFSISSARRCSLPLQPLKNGRQKEESGTAAARTAGRVFRASIEQSTPV